MQTSLHTGLTENLGSVQLRDNSSSPPELRRQDTTMSMNDSPENKKRKRSSEQGSIPKTPDTLITTPDTPSTVLLDDDGETIPGQEEKIKQHELYNKMRKYKMVPYNVSRYLEDVFVKKPDGTFEPLSIKGETFLLKTMSKDDFYHGIQAYDYQGKKKESDNLFQGGKKRRTRKKKSLKKKSLKKKRKISTRRK